MQTTPVLRICLLNPGSKHTLFVRLAYLLITFICLVEWITNSFLIFFHIWQDCSSTGIAPQLPLCLFYSKSWPYCIDTKGRHKVTEIPIPVDYLWNMVKLSNILTVASMDFDQQQTNTHNVTNVWNRHLGIIKIKSSPGHIGKAKMESTVVRVYSSEREWKAQAGGQRISTWLKEQ